MTKWNDGGYKSRKFWFAVGVAVLISAGAVMVGFKPAMGTVYAEFVSGLLGLSGLLFTGNIAAKWVAGKASQAIVAPEPVQPPPSPLPPPPQ